MKSKKCNTFNDNVCSAVKCAFLLGNSFSVINYGRKIEQLKSTDQVMDGILVGKIRCVIGLTQVCMGKFDLGVKTLSQIPVEVMNHFPEIISPDDLSTVAVLSAMACLSRTENSNIKQSGFRELVAIAPQDVCCCYYYSSYYDSNCSIRMY